MPRPGNPPAAPDTLPARNNFDLIRLAAALLVLASHAYVLTGQAEREPVARLLAHVTDGGGLAVGTFFVISGLLIARSARRHPPLAYARARVLRIVPAYLVLILLQALLLGPALTALPLRTYLTDPALGAALLRALAFSPPPGLPGLFAANPVPDQVNGSLWTLRIEALCYAGLLALSLAGLLRPRLILLPLAAAWALLGATLAARAGVAPSAWAALKLVAIVDCGLHFAMGAALWTYRAWRGPLGRWALAALALFAATAATPLAPVTFHLALPLAVLWLATGPTLPRPARDISYGVYLYAFPVQQALVALQPGLAPLPLMAEATLIAIPLGLLSHLWIERPALRWRYPALTTS